MVKLILISLISMIHFLHLLMCFFNPKFQFIDYLIDLFIDYSFVTNNKMYMDLIKINREIV